MSSTMDRRSFLGRGAMVAGGGLLAAGTMQGLVARTALGTTGPGRGRAGLGDGGYGNLRPAGPELALPKGFTYRMFGVEGTPMSDGNATPRAHDGMGALALPNGNVRLIRNHEDRDVAALSVPIGDAAVAYDQKGGGGNTSLEVRPDGERELVRDFVSLNGTIVNCAGGNTPWGTWLSCEESTQGEFHGREQDHGYNFEIPLTAEDEVTPVPLKAMGRFVHEAVAVDPRTLIVYETEDRNPSGFFRFIPNVPAQLAQGGRLQVLAVQGRPGYDTRTGQTMGANLPVAWVDIPDPDPAAAEINPSAVYESAGGEPAIFSRLEGCWYGEGSVFFHSTDGGEAGLGQVWQYTPRGNSGGQLKLLFESPNVEVLDSPDNITVSPRGGIVICEDGGGTQFLRGLTRDGRIFDFCVNITNEREFAGACFSPDGDTLFVNIQGDTTSTDPDDNLGMTFAIWGPWEEGAL